jgi:ketosteroid isomerase-like protein
MIERDTALRHAQDWVDAWNAHDPERVVADFADDVVVTSPMIEQIRPGSGGVLRDKASVLSYYRDGLAASGDLHFTLIEVCTGVDTIAIVYRNHRDIVVVETLRRDDRGRTVEVSVAYNA